MKVYVVWGGKELPDAATGLHVLRGQERVGNLLMPMIEEADLIDPWARPYRYVTTETGFRLESSGPDRVFGNSDDICVSGQYWPTKGDDRSD